MPEGSENATNLNSVIEEQSKTIKTLVEKFKTSISGADQQPIYWNTPTGKKVEAPNFALFIGIGLAAWFLLRKRI